MERLPLNALRAFALVLERGGVRAAARELAVSHSAVSRHLRELESWLGVGLFEKRDRGGLRPTAHGRLLAEASRSALHAIQQAVDAVREQRSSHSLSVSTTPSFAARWLLPRLPALERAYPRLEISVVVDQRLDEPGSFPCDIAIRTGKGPWPGLLAEVLMKECLYPVMSPALWRQSGRPTDPSQLRGLRLLHDRDPNASWQLWREKYGPATLDVRRGPRFASSDLALRAAAQGLGVALARDRLAQDELASGALLRPFGAHAIDLGAAYWIVRPHGGAPREAVRTFTAWVRQQAARQGGGHPR
jgi:LysR family transcriptional regulator, glycine cleavage system transcriptional activator